MAPTEVYWCAISHYARMPIIFARTAGIEIDEKVVDMVKGEHKSEEYMKMFPLHRVPGMKEGDFLLTESVAILQYLAAKKGVADHWYPADPRKRARVNEYIMWHATGMIPKSNLFRIVVVQHHYYKKPLNEEEVKTMTQDLNQAFDFVEKHFLANSNFLTGDDPSIADIYAMVAYSQMEVVGFDVGKNRPRMAAWYQRMKDKTNPHYDAVTKPVVDFAAPCKRDF